VTHDKAELILHPVRLKILQALVGDRVLSTRQLGQLLPDVAQATLYRGGRSSGFIDWRKTRPNYRIQKSRPSVMMIIGDISRHLWRC
jgi:Helix-turn-helix domain